MSIPCLARSAMALTLLSGSVHAATLYDPGLGTLPTAQAWATLAGGNAPAQSVASGLLRTDTLTDPAVVQFVDYRSPPAAIALDTAAGFTLSFDLQVRAETHQSENRAGYSMLVQGLDQTKALELSFWTDQVWAMNYSSGAADSGFVHGNGALLDTASSIHHYALTVQNNAYALWVDGSSVLTGGMIDYPVLGLSTVVYGFSNTLFIGDDSSRGQAITDLGLVSISAVPESATAFQWLLGLGLLMGVPGLRSAAGGGPSAAGIR